MPESFLAFAIKKVVLMTRVVRAMLLSPPARDADASLNRLVELLIRKSGDDQEDVDILAIVGMAGSGKSTLANELYNHQLVKKHFNCRAWVALSQLSDPSAVLLEILRQTAIDNKKKKPRADKTINEVPPIEDLGSRLQKVLRPKKCLLVLDDVWRSESLSKILPLITSAGFHKIVVTSRSYNICPDSSLRWSYHDVQCLSEEDSWKLFEKVACGNGGGLDLTRQSWSVEALRKCEGLPLAIVALGNILRTKYTIQEWEREFTRIKGAEGKCLYPLMKKTLDRSYDMLPDHLKPCFLYLGIFPEGSSIFIGPLTRMWMAEGIVNKREDEDTLEEAVQRCLQELIDYTMVQVVKRNHAGQVKIIKVHNILRYLCIMKSRELNFTSIFCADLQSKGTSSQQPMVDIRHLELHTQNSDLKSLVLFAQDQGHQIAFNIATIFQKFRLLEVLDLVGIRTADGTLSGKVINCLIQLRYLRIRSTNIHKLSKSIAKLSNLLTLDYRHVIACSGIDVPNVLSGLKQLRHLYLPTEMNIVTGGLKLHSIKKLQTLWGVSGANWNIGKDTKFNSALEKLYVQEITRKEELDGVLNSPIISKYDHLCALSLDWSGFELHSLEAICKKNSLQRVKLKGSVSDKLNHLTFPSNLQKVQFYYTQLQNPETMHALGRLPCLKYLKLSKDSYIGSIWMCREEAFPQLVELHLSHLRSLEQWNMVRGAMPRLKKLSIVSCINLCRVPLNMIHTLEKLVLEKMPHNFCNSIQQAREPQGETSTSFNFNKSLTFKSWIPLVLWAVNDLLLMAAVAELPFASFSFA